MENKEITYSAALSEMNDGREKIIDNLNKVGNVELGKRVRAMTVDEQYACAENIPVDILLDVIGTKFARYQEFEANVISLMAKFKG